MLKTSTQLASALLATSVDNSKVVGSSARNDKKSAKSNFTKLVCRVEEFDFLSSDTSQVFTQWKQAFTKALIFQNFDPECHI